MQLTQPNQESVISAVNSVIFRNFLSGNFCVIAHLGRYRAGDSICFALFAGSVTIGIQSLKVARIIIGFTFTFIGPIGEGSEHYAH
jgi:hypothetical protein